MKIIFYVQNTSIFMDFGEYGGGANKFHRTFFVYYSKKRKKYKSMHDQYLNQILHHFDIIKNFVRLIILFLGKGGPSPVSLRSEYSGSN